ncbi:hypothetical protein AB834_03610 [PVC group bacterium (ex Bugula neritina AB1)]|nr:hypothetical protein AB834_03610 [PVC group bacterium (ex Bugula neritina AB1)]
MFVTFSITIIISSFFVISVYNTVHSAFFLILSFFNGSCLLLLSGSDFLGFLFIIIYVGAISVLFLFVIMILNLNQFDFSQKHMKLDSPSYLFYLFLFSCCFLSFVYIIFIMLTWPAYNHAIPSTYLLNYIQIIDSINNVNTFSQILYTHYFFYLLLSGVILLAAMVGSVYLTLNKVSFFKKTSKFQQAHNQISRISSASISLIKYKRYHDLSC